jgi:hypothetical protein
VLELQFTLYLSCVESGTSPWVKARVAFLRVTRVLRKKCSFINLKKAIRTVLCAACSI